jgi:hypothetical protein
MQIGFLMAKMGKEFQRKSDRLEKKLKSKEPTGTS